MYDSGGSPTLRGDACILFEIALQSILSHCPAMLRVTQSQSASGAVAYFETALKQSDYYSEGETVAAYWGGKGSEILNLSGEVSKDDFASLAHGKNPSTGENLTARQKENRRPGYDFTFSVPKSFSVAMGATADEDTRERLGAILRDSVKETMADIEADMKTRVRSGNRNEDRTTANMVWAAFEHDTTRPIDGRPDPHAHIHVYAMNATFDGEEKKWKAGQFGDIKRDAVFFQECFHSRVAEKLQEAGYGIRRTERDFELAAVSPETVQRFSKRTAEIEKTAKENINKIEKHARAIVRDSGKDYGDALAEAKSQLGAKTRAGKTKGMDAESLRSVWREEMGSDQAAAIADLKASPSANLLGRDEAIRQGVEHSFERASVADERRVLADCLRKGVGGGFSVEDARKGLSGASRDIITKDMGNGKTLVTTRAVIADEGRMAKLCREGKGAARPFAKAGAWEVRRDFLNPEQRKAVEHVLTSSDKYTGIRGMAGTGKTTMMEEAIEGIKAESGKNVFTFAPSSEAVAVLKSEGFKDSATVAHLLHSKKLQNEVKGGVLWVDEAGLVSGKDCRKLFDIAEENNCRVVLTGDKGQHRAVERGDTLRILERDGGLEVAELKSIMRQKHDGLKDAVSDFAHGDASGGFQKMLALGSVHEMDDKDGRNNFIADTYMDKSARGTTLVVAPTHAEGAAVTSRIREKLQESGTLSSEEHSRTRLVNKGWTEAQRSDATSFEQGQTVQFHAACGTFKKGQQWQVTGIKDGEVSVSRDGKEGSLPLHNAKHFNVYEPRETEFAEGDIVRATANANGLKNNSLHRISSIDGERMELEPISGKGKGKTVEGDSVHLSHGYTVTSHASQGKTVDHVIVAQSSESLSVASVEQAYVSISRARHSAEWITDDTEALGDAIERSDARFSSLDLVKNRLGKGVGNFPKNENRIDKQTDMENEEQQKRKAVPDRDGFTREELQEAERFFTGNAPSPSPPKTGRETRRENQEAGEIKPKAFLEADGKSHDADSGNESAEEDAFSFQPEDEEAGNLKHINQKGGDELPGKEADEPAPGSPGNAQEIDESRKQGKGVSR